MGTLTTIILILGNEPLDVRDVSNRPNVALHAEDSFNGSYLQNRLLATDVQAHSQLFTI